MIDIDTFLEFETQKRGRVVTRVNDDGVILSFKAGETFTYSDRDDFDWSGEKTKTKVLAIKNPFGTIAPIYRGSEIVGYNFIFSQDCMDKAGLEYDLQREGLINPEEDTHTSRIQLLNYDGQDRMDGVRAMSYLFHSRLREPILAFDKLVRKKTNLPLDEKGIALEIDKEFHLRLLERRIAQFSEMNGGSEITEVLAETVPTFAQGYAMGLVLTNPSIDLQRKLIGVNQANIPALNFPMSFLTLSRGHNTFSGAAFNVGQIGFSSGFDSIAYTIGGSNTYSSLGMKHLKGTKSLANSILENPYKQ